MTINFIDIPFNAYYFIANDYIIKVTEIVEEKRRKEEHTHSDTDLIA